MQARATKDILLQTPHLEEATAFYRDVLGLRVFLNTPDLVGLDAGAFSLYLDRAGSLGPVLEFLVANLSEARRELLDKGCTVIADDPTIPRLYLRDPFGMVYNIGQDAHAAQTDPEPIRDPEPPPHY
jgi:catechol 2,3-dioxygenase-like lactoylglutathione lyase family enzyme